MSIVFNCPQCNREIKAADRYAGRRTRCPHCQGAMLVPGVASETVAESAAMPPSAASPELDVPAANSLTESQDPYRTRWKSATPATTALTGIVSGPAADAHPALGVNDLSDRRHQEHGEDHSPLIPLQAAGHEDLIDMTAMVDIVFFLLIFFLTTSMQSLQAVMDLPTPQTATDKGAARSVSDLANDKETLMVKIQEDDTIWIDDEQVFSDQDLIVKLRQARDDAGGKALSLVVVGNADASHGAAIRVFDAGAAAAVGSISLLVQEDTDSGN